MNHANKTFTAYRVLTAYRDSYRVFYHVPADGTAADETGRIAALLHRRGEFHRGACQLKTHIDDVGMILHAIVDGPKDV